MYLDLVSELAHYKDRCYRAEEECTGLKKERRQMESSHALATSASNNVSKILLQNSMQINSLKKKAQLHKDLEPFLCIGDADCEALAAQHILTHFRAMKARISTIFILKGVLTPRLRMLYDNSDDLDLLLTTVFDAGYDSRVKAISNVCPAFTFSDLVQGLTGAAIHRWVFQCEYRSYATTITPLLQKYREHIATLCGDERLCSLDTAAHHSLLGEKTFVEATIPRMGNSLTTRFLTALQPLFDQCPKYDTSRSLKPLLRDIFQLAIQIRTLSLNGQEDYESIWPLSGSSFDVNDMETKHLGTMSVADIVWLTICPGLRAYSKNKEMVQYRAFGVHQEPKRAPRYVIKALTLATKYDR
ncbi:hypothetical protein BKA66DRAFT_527493 [Pyrenochaeta sp. MPI-SDFR-AT-0127]|nr:hypothetical protein BKA66DRAFT_527493 [Pyrenochaeta sp. MPI-SDFR-AT-0127]